MKKILCSILVIILTISVFVPAAGADEIAVFYNGDEIVFDVNPIVIDGRTLVPMRAIFETFGATVNYDAQTKTITAERTSQGEGMRQIILSIGSKNSTVSINGIAQGYVLDVEPVVINGRTLVPLRFIGEALGATVDWDGTTKTVTIVSNNDSNGVIAGRMKVGDYVEFGSYYGEPILWKCVNKEGYSVMLVSEYILCQKAFDAQEESGVWGSNVWADSNIREWLNSSSQTVSFTTQAPVASEVWDGINAYADEPGFLNNFTQVERNMLKAVNHDGVTDKVYLLSEEEVIVYISDSEFTNRQMTSIGREKGEFKYNTEGNYWYYWTRTPNTDTSDFVRLISRSNYLGGNYSYAWNSAVGVLPALNLKSDIYESGKGTVDEPYVVTGN